MIGWLTEQIVLSGETESRSLADRLATLGGAAINVKLEWGGVGALGDGIADDSAAIQRALDAAEAMFAKAVYMPPGRYMVGETIQIPNGVTIYALARKTAVLAPMASLPLTDQVFEQKVTTPGSAVRGASDITIWRLAFDGALRVYPRWLEHVAPHAAAGTPVLNPQADYTAPGVLNAALYPTGIAGVVAAGRRNSAYDTKGPMIRLRKVNRPRVIECDFYDHKSMVISDEGSLDGEYIGNTFERCCKNDAAVFCIWVGHTGVSGDVDYVPSQGTLVAHNTARDLERVFCLFAPNAGGRMIYNTIENVKEAGLFAPDKASSAGGQTIIAHNTVKGVRISDIQAAGIESFGSSRVHIFNNYIEDVDCEIAVLIGGTDKIFENNYCRNAWALGRTATFPYGPFSERYAYNVGTPIIAGTTEPLEVRSMIRLGSSASGAVMEPGIRSGYRRNVFIQDIAGSHMPMDFALLQRTGGAAANIADALFIEDNDLTGLPTEMRVLTPANPTLIAVAQTLGAAGPLTLVNAAQVLLPARKVTLTSVGNDTGVNFTITGTASTGAALVEVRSGANAGVATSTNVFRTVASIAASAATAGNVSAGTAPHSPFLRLASASVMTSDMDLRIRGNRGHTSEGIFLFEYTFPITTTGLLEFTDGLNGLPSPGFRPSFIEAVAITQAATETRQSLGFARWQRGVLANASDAGSSWSNSTTGARSVMGANLVNILDPATGTPQFTCGLNAWLENGFRVNVTTATDGARVRFICHP